MASTLSQPKVALITAIAGGKNSFMNAPKWPGVDTIMFTDVVVPPVYNWQTFELPQFSQLSRAPRRNAKLPKVMPFLFLPDYEFVIWQDGGHMAAISPQRLIKKYLIDQDKDVAAFRHGRDLAGLNHNCIFKEADNIKHIGFLEDPAIIDEQVAAYRAEGMPEEYGLSCNASMMWRNCRETWRLQLTWWEQICRYSSRDQMSFFYSLWKTDMKKRFTYIDGHWEKNNEIPRKRGHINPEQ